MATWLGKLDGGQLDLMWQFLQFHGDKPTVKEIEAIEENLDRLRVMMVQKGDGTREGQDRRCRAVRRHGNGAEQYHHRNDVAISGGWLKNVERGGEE